MFTSPFIGTEKRSSDVGARDSRALNARMGCAPNLSARSSGAGFPVIAQMSGWYNRGFAPTGIPQVLFWRCMLSLVSDLGGDFAFFAIASKSGIPDSTCSQRRSSPSFHGVASVISA